MTTSPITTDQMKARTKQFALRVLKVCKALPKTDEAKIVGRQLLRSGTSVGANYRAVCRARSDKDFVSKLGIVIEESDESAFWLELLADGAILPAKKLAPLRQECDELLAIFAASQKTIKARMKGRQENVLAPKRER